MRSVLTTTAIALCVLGGTALAARDNIRLSVPQSMNFQGYLEQTGNPITDTMDMWFGIYDSPSGGSVLYQTTANGVAVIRGYFNVLLTSIPATVFPASGPVRYLEVKAPSGQPALSPRVQLASVGYSYQSLTSDTAQYARDADKLDSRNAGNANGDVPISNGTACTNLNADMVDSKQASDFVDLVSSQTIGGSKSFSTSVSVSGTVTATGYWASSAGNNNAVNVANSSSSYPTIYARNSSSSNCISARNTGSSYPAIFAKQEGNGVGVWCEGDNGVYAVATRSGSYPAGYFYSYGGSNSNSAIHAIGEITSTGYFIALPETDGQSPGFAVVSPEVEVHTSGSGKLINGEATINLDERLAAAMSSETPVRVIVTPTEQCLGVYVAVKSRAGFTVRELADGHSSASFDWLLIGRKLGHEQTPVVTRPPAPGPNGSSQ